MALTYAQILSRTSRVLQDTGNNIFSSAELGQEIEDGLKRMAQFDPVIVEEIYKLESRTGTDTAGTANALTDTTNSQFVAVDETNQKVVHNITESTWAVVKNYTSTSVLALGRDIMNLGDVYEIYNKHCTNQRQIYLGDTPAHLWIDSVEYPLGTRRNFTQPSWNIVELDVDDSVIPDSDSTLDPPNDIRVLIRFAMPHVVSQLTDWDGELSGAAVEGATTISIDGMGTTETIEVGEMFNLEDHLTTYIVTAEVTMVAGAGDVVFYPPLEAASLNNDDITFLKTTLNSSQDNIICRLAAAKAAINKVNLVVPLSESKARPYLTDGSFTINESNKGGPGTSNDYLQYAKFETALVEQYRYYHEWGQRELARVEEELSRMANPRVSEIFPKT